MSQSFLRPSFPGLAAAIRGRSGDGEVRAAAAPQTLSPVALRTGLLAGCAVAIGIAVWIADPSGYLQADRALAQLLRGMAMIKGIVTIGAIGAVSWRLGWPVSGPVAVTYAVTSWVLAGTTMLIWQLTYIPLAAILFHAAALCMVLVAWRER